MNVDQLEDPEAPSHLRLVEDRPPSLPPHDQMAERVVACNVVENTVGSEKPRILEVMGIVEPEDFFDSAWRSMYRAARAIHERGEDVTPNSVAAHLEDIPARGTGSWDRFDRVKFFESLRDAPEERNLAARAERIRDLARRRTAVEQASRLAMKLRDCSEAPTKELLAESVAKLEEIAADIAPMSIPTREQYIAKAWEQSEQQDRAPKISTGIAGVDAVLGGGWEVGTLTLLGAPYGTGKSLFAGCSGARAAARGEPVLVAICDSMTPEGYFVRMAGERASVPAKFLRSGAPLQDAARNDFYAALQALGQTPIEVRGGIGSPECSTPAGLRASLKRARGPIGRVRLVFLDYVQAMALDPRCRDFEATQIKRNGDELAKIADGEGLALVGLVQTIKSGENKGQIKACRALADVARVFLVLRGASKGRPQYEDDDLEQQELYVDKQTHGKKDVAAPLTLNTRILRYTDGDQ